jgi:pimeloyl-ACP methyl ester carboxylesterase
MPTNRSWFTFCLLCLAVYLPAQSFTEKQFGWRVEPDISYGTAINYLGLEDNLTLDLYKPVGDDNQHRPLLVLIHGGSWLGGCKEDMQWLAIEMAQRGYAVASVNYRKGWHKSAYVANPSNPSIFPGGNALYAADSMEIMRAIYRGQQDVKGAIRWLKARAIQDSTCNRSVLVAGESAGAFLALATALIDRDSEKPASCGALANAPTPGANLANSYVYNCVQVDPPLPSNALNRPDLGPIHGTMNPNNYDASVVGVISFYGGVPWEAVAQNWIEGPNQPALYLYHQTCDGIVPFGLGQPMFVISNFCNLGFTPWHYNYPQMFGNGAIAAYLNALPNAPAFTTSFINCDAFFPGLALFECARFSQNGSYHFVHNRISEAQKIADFYNPIISNLQTTPGCLVNTDETSSVQPWQISPNPARDKIYLRHTNGLPGDGWIKMIDLSGKIMLQQSFTANNTEGVLETGALPKGLYFIWMQTGDKISAGKVMLE